mmetsp:Transcript_30670/g.30307  ORF Transcript_30670/g.30307 Transcript_30670/m.30307 type:complete len:157 (+) Transcript_30670:2-472(+)
MLKVTIALLICGVFGFWGSSDTGSDVSLHMPHVIKSILEEQGISAVEAKLIAQSYLAKNEGMDFKKLENSILTGDLFKYIDEWRKGLFSEIFPQESKELLKRMKMLPFSYEYYQAITASFDDCMDKKPKDEDKAKIKVSHDEIEECPVLVNFPYTF